MTLINLLTCLCLLIGSLFVRHAFTCGITTHTEIGHRAAFHYEYILDSNISVNSLIYNYQPAFQAGNPYPDTFFPTVCKKGIYHNVSEDTHWVPFINETIRYIQTNYKKPYTEDALRLIVFLLGFTSHQIADVTWHSLDVEQGFLSSMGFVNFHGSFPDAHFVGDTGSDVVNQYDLNTDYIADFGDWYVPYKDLFNIYQKYYGAVIVTEDDIVECNSLLFLARLAEQLVFAALYDYYSIKSTFLTNKLNDFFLGGIDDMAAWTQLSWNKVLYMLENGVDKCHLDHNILYVNCDSSYRNSLEKQNKNIINKNKQTSKHSNRFSYIDKNLILDKSYMEFVYSKSGVTFKPSKKFYDELNNKKQQISKYIEDKKLVSETKTKPKGDYVMSNVTYYSLQDYANIGWSLAAGDLNNDKSDDLIIGAPVYPFTNAYQSGLVFILLSNNGLPNFDIKLENSADYIIFNPDKNMNSTKFGHSVTVIDLNRDGFNDIVVSAPSYNLENIKYQGRVYVYYGSGSPNYYDYQTPSVIITCEDYQYCNLGWSMNKGDVDGDGFDDLIVGSPYANTCGAQCGFVGVLLSKQKQYQPVISVKQLDWFITGNMEYEWFGFNMNQKLGYLAVGAPQSRFCYLSNCTVNDKDVQAIGRVYLYKYPSTTPVIILNGIDEFQQFGYDMDFSIQLSSKRKVLAISSYTKDSQIYNATTSTVSLTQGGVLQVYDITDINNVTEITVLKSDRSYAGFGAKIKFYDVNNDGAEDLFISAPLRTDNTINIGKVSEGIVFMFKGGDKFPVGNYTDVCPGSDDHIPCPDIKADLMLQQDENKMRFGKTFEFLRLNATSNVIQMAVSSPRSDNGISRLSGKINIFYFGIK